LGVNITFLPMHFIGLRGAPRKYIQIVDAFYVHNTIRTLGSHFSIFGLILFIRILYERLMRVRRIVVKIKTTSVVYDTRRVTFHTFKRAPG
jgi:heme/copper-type cytochrome/quinol oxidase subunit 1